MQSENEGIARVERLFEQLRDELLAASHTSAKSTRDWERAAHFFSLSKKVDELRSMMSQQAEAPSTKAIAAGDGITAEGAPERRRKLKREYPKYAVRSDSLIKTGLSRDRRTEYEHAVPKPEFDAVLARLSELAGRRHFSADDVIEKVPCPSYQSYIVMSLLRERGLLAVPRRGVYAFTRPKSFLNEAREIWQSLEKHQIENAHE